MLNILFIIGTYPTYGGAEKVTTVLANEFDKRGYSVFIASFSQPHPELAAKELNASVKLIELSYPVSKRENKQILKLLVKTEKIDFIINQWCLPFYVTKLCRIAIGSTKCKLIAVHHNAPNKNARIVGLEDEISNKDTNIIKRNMYLIPKLIITKAIIRNSMRYVYRRSDKYVVLSESFLKVFSKFTGIQKPLKLKVIANPITIDSINENIKKENLIIYVGRVDYNQKRVHRVIEFWADIYKKYPEWKLAIVGDGPERKHLEEFVEDKGINNILFEGFQNPLPYYQKAKILLLTSEYEGFPLVIVEGISYGVIPVIYGSYPAVYDIIDDGKDGIILTIPYKKMELVEHIEKLIHNENQIDSMSKLAKIKSNNYSLLRIMNIWEDFLSKEII